MWFTAFLITQIFEMPIYASALGGRAWWKRLLIAYGASALTHPLVWTAAMSFPSLNWWLVVAFAETFAVLVEAAYLHVHGLERAVLWALIANGTSFGLGLVIYELIDIYQ